MSSALWIARTAIFIAVLVVAQLVTTQFGTTLITGSLVNMILILAVMTCGFSSGLTVAVVSPIVAKLLGIGPFWSIIPFIIIGNFVLVALWHKIGNRQTHNRSIDWVLALILAAVAKFIVIFLGVTKIAIPILLSMTEPQATALSTAFSFPQLCTACIGGILAILLLPSLKKVIR